MVLLLYDDGDDDEDDNVADTCSPGLLQRPRGQKIATDKEDACHFYKLNTSIK